MSSIWYVILSVLGILVFIVGGIALLVFMFHKKVEQGKALIVNTMRKEPVVTFTGMVVYPVIHKAEVMEISLKTIEIDRRGKEGLICSDNIRADIRVSFFVRVNKTQEDVLKVAQAIGCARASDQSTLEELFNAKFSEALKTVGKQMDFEDLYKERDSFRDQIIALIGKDLNGYVLEDAAIDYLEQTPLSSLDPKNILDAQGIRKITQLTATQNIQTNEIARDEEMQIKKKDVQAREAILELERQQADAEAKQQREIESLRAREEAETEKVRSEERLRSEQARIKTDESLAVMEENKLRETEVAAQNRARAVAIEVEKVERARALEAIAREREVELQRIAKEKALEEEKKAIAEVIRERTAVDKTVAEEEERIKELRIVSEADRSRKAKVIEAEAAAQQNLVESIKAAEAAEEAAKHKAREQLTLAEAELAAADKLAAAKIRIAEGTQAEAAAHGLAAARVKEASAVALEKEGTAQARVLREQKQAEAEGEEQIGMARVKVLESETAAMEQMGDRGEAYEQFRMKLEHVRALQGEALLTQRAVAEQQAQLLGSALKNAKFEIIGGDGAFFDRFVKAVSVTKSLDGFLEKGDTAKQIFGDYIDGDASLRQDLKDVLTNPAIDAEAAKNLTLTAFLGKLMQGSDGDEKAKVERLLAAAKQLGLE